MSSKLDTILEMGDLVRPELLPGLMGMGLTEQQERLVSAFLMMRQSMAELFPPKDDASTLALAFAMLSDHLRPGDPEQFLDHPMTPALRDELPDNIHGFDRERLLLGMLVTKLTFQLNERMFRVKPTDLAEA